MEERAKMMIPEWGSIAQGGNFTTSIGTMGGCKTKLERHKEICADLSEIYRKKNEAYGDSFGKTYRELGIISAVTRMEDKMNRIASLATGAKNEVTDESLADSICDLANYAIMTLIEMKQKDA